MTPVDLAPQVVEQFQRRRRAALATLRELAEEQETAGHFYAGWAGHVVEIAAARSARVWIPTTERNWKLLTFAGTESYDAADADEALRLTRLEEIETQARPRVTSELRSRSPTTVVWFPLLAARRVRSVVEVHLPPNSETAAQGCLALLADAAGAVERFHLLQDRRDALSLAAAREAEQRFLAAVRPTLDSTAAAYAIANEGRLLIRCDRLTIFKAEGTRCRALAVSGQSELDRRSTAVRSLESIAARAAAARQRFSYPDAEGLDPATEAEAARYVDSFNVKRLLVVPLERREPDDGENVDGPIVGVAVAEYFGGLRQNADDQRCLEVVAREGATALAIADEHESLFLQPVWKALGRVRRELFAPGARLRTLSAALGIAAVVAGSIFIPADYTAFCRGTLQPVERRRIFAPEDGIVKRIFVQHGDKVTRGRPLLELRNTELELAITDAEGKRTEALQRVAAVERLLLDDGRRLPAEQQARLAGERSEAREEVAALERRLALYEERRRRLSIVSPIDGQVLTWDAANLLENRPVRTGQIVLSIAAVDGPWQLELAVPDDLSGRIAAAAAEGGAAPLVTFSPVNEPQRTYEARIVEMQSSTEVRGEHGNTLLIRAAFAADAAPRRRPGIEVAAHVHCGRKSTAYVWTKGVIDFLRTQVWFRWFG